MRKLMANLCQLGNNRIELLGWTKIQRVTSMNKQVALNIAQNFIEWMAMSIGYSDNLQEFLHSGPAPSIISRVNILENVRFIAQLQLSIFRPTSPMGLRIAPNFPMLVFSIPL
jgi:hypothetical protein